VIVASGRIVSVLDGVGTTRTGHDEPARSIEGGTVGAGAERSAVDPPLLVDAEPAPGTQFPGAGGASGVDSPVRVDTVLDATGLVVAPGFIDLQCNGALGVDLTSEPDRLGDIAAGLPRWGVTAWLPTVVTSPPAERLAVLRAFRDRRDVESGPVGATPLGLHLEGPFLAPARRGAHDLHLLTAPSLTLVDDEGWSRAAGVALVTLAPELPGALDVVRALVDRGVVVAAGHSSATASEARAALDAGVTGVTHLFNAMGGLHHREPGLAGVALTDPRPHVWLIADGVHVDPAVVALAAGALGDRTVLVTDAVAALGTRAILLALYSYYQDTQDMWCSLYRDLGKLDALDEPMRQFDEYLATVEEAVLRTWAPRRSKKLRATVRHALRFTSWQSLAEQGLKPKPMSALVCMWIEAAAG
jgi:hypothetical protein